MAAARSNGRLLRFKVSCVNFASMTPHRFRRNLRLKFGISRALLIAAAFSLSHPRTAWPRIRAAFTTWLDFARTPRMSPFWVYFSRLRTCQRCPFYSRRLQTCGSPLEKDISDVGCFCFMPVKSSYIEATCWYRTATNGDKEFGWPDHLTRLSNIPSLVRPKCGTCGSLVVESQKMG